MSQNVDNFAHYLVEMAKAMETLPMREAEIRDLRSTLDSAQSHNQGLEQNISNYKQTIEDLNNKVRSLEVERDDASFRVLEAEDREHVATAMARSIASAIGNLVTTLDPPKPQPEAEKPVETPDPATFTGFEPDHRQDKAETTLIQPQGSSESSPTSQNSDTQQHTGEQSGQSSTHTEEAPNSDANPTGQVLQTQETQTTSGSTTEQGNVSEPPKGPYFNKRYHDELHYITLPLWLEGGGTEADYHWRPSHEQRYGQDRN